jgi:hypothetical protein
LTEYFGQFAENSSANRKFCGFNASQQKQAVSGASRGTLHRKAAPGLWRICGPDSPWELQIHSR